MLLLLPSKARHPKWTDVLRATQLIKCMLLRVTAVLKVRVGEGSKQLALVFCYLLVITAHFMGHTISCILLNS